MNLGSRALGGVGNWLLEKLQAEQLIRDDDEIESDHLEESDDEGEEALVAAKSKLPNIVDSAQRMMSEHSNFSLPHELDRVDSVHGVHGQTLDEENRDEDEAELSEHLTAEQEEYRRFLQSIWDEDDGDETADDDEDYEPESDNDAAPAEGEDEDDPNIDEETVKVNKKELRELVSDCWLTIAGQQVGDMDLTVRTPDPVEVQSGAGISAHPSDLPGSSPSSLIDAPGRNLDTIRSTSRAVSHSVLSTLVTQLFTGNKLSDLCIDGIPVGAIRKVVARQISMALQLLLQLLLQADDRSGCFATGYNCLIELSNFRELAVRKAVLMQQNVRNVSALKHVKSDHTRNRMMEVNELQRLMQASAPYPPPTPGVAEGAAPDAPTENSRGGAPQRMTRSDVVRYNEQSQRSSSLFDVPVLARIRDVLACTDQAKLIIKQRIQTVNPMTPLPTFFLSGDLGASGGQSLSRARSTALLLACEEQLVQFCNYFGMRTWRSLVPTLSHPIKDYLELSLDPLSAVGRAFFTPAEDDLLLRGIAALGEESKWNEIRLLFLPSKDPPVLQFRHTQQTVISVNSERNGFKRYQQFAAEARAGRVRDESWTLTEDCFLLKGFGVFGAKWNLLPLFFLPHRKPDDIKNRWAVLLKAWQRASQQGMGAGLHGSNIVITPDLQRFLRETSLCHSQAQVQGLVQGTLFAQEGRDEDGPGGLQMGGLSDDDSSDDDAVRVQLPRRAQPPAQSRPTELSRARSDRIDPYDVYLSNRLASSQEEVRRGPAPFPVAADTDQVVLPSISMRYGASSMRMPAPTGPFLLPPAPITALTAPLSLAHAAVVEVLAKKPEAREAGTEAKRRRVGASEPTAPAPSVAAPAHPRAAPVAAQPSLPVDAAGLTAMMDGDISLSGLGGFGDGEVSMGFSNFTNFSRIASAFKDAPEAAPAAAPSRLFASVMGPSGTARGER